MTLLPSLLLITANYNFTLISILLILPIKITSTLCLKISIFFQNKKVKADSLFLYCTVFDNCYHDLYKKYKKYSHKRSVYVQLSVGPHFSCVNDSDMMQLALSDLFFIRQSSRQNLRENLFRKPVLDPAILFPFPLF